MGLSGDDVSSLTLANAFGLAAVRLLDDLVDGDIDEDAAAALVLLPTALHQLWMQRYVVLFGRDAEFWRHVQRFLGQWLEATYGATEAPSTPFASFDDEDFRHLAHRGAPLKACAVAACMLAEQRALIEPLIECLDHLLAGAVLLDQVKDWAADLAAYRYNLFVAFATSRPQTAKYELDNRNAVLRAIGTGEVSAYFDVLISRLVQAQVLAGQVASTPLAAHVQDYQDHVIRVQEQLDAAAAARLAQITDLLFGEPEPEDGSS
jgi:hypothetical protein